MAGVVARTRVTQRFMNPGTDWREGIYVFPLPETAAVDHLDMRIGTRRIVGQIRERGQARREYEQAKAEGKKAALVEQERPNLFTTSVAPIGPNEEVSVSIEYQQPLRQDNGAWSLRFPMAITPRYVPGTPLPLAAVGEGWAEDTDRVPDASRITPPVVHPSAGKINPVTLTMDLDAGVPLARLDSRYHAAKVVEHPGHRYTLTLDGPVPADRDFEVTWVPELGHAPSAAVFGETREGRGYALVMLMPTLPEAPTPRLAREVTFVIDTSGSMEGPSIVQAKAALALALERLQPGDRFNVIEFNSNARALFAVPMPVDPATLGRARTFVGRLKADGGTEMHKALTLALQPGEGTPGLVRQVVFLTDGAVGNEDELFKLIRDRLGDRRLFTVGIGSAPNAHFMRKAAEFGRGTHTLIGDANEVQLKMGLLFRKLESPVLTDVTIDWPAGSEAWPGQVGDLYAGEPLVATASLRGLDGEIVVRGRFAGTPWRASLPLSASGGHEGIHALWARAKIDALTDAQVAGANADDVRAEIVRIALAHHLVTRHTSLVAVDVTPTMPAGTPVRSSAMPGNLPEGQDFEAIFGGLPQTATPAAQHLAIALAALVAGAAAPRVEPRRVADRGRRRAARRDPAGRPDDGCRRARLADRRQQRRGARPVARAGPKPGHGRIRRGPLRARPLRRDHGSTTMRSAIERGGPFGGPATDALAYAEAQGAAPGTEVPGSAPAESSPLGRRSRADSGPAPARPCSRRRASSSRRGSAGTRHGCTPRRRWASTCWRARGTRRAPRTRQRSRGRGPTPTRWRGCARRRKASTSWSSPAPTGARLRGGPGTWREPPRPASAATPWSPATATRTSRSSRGCGVGERIDVETAEGRTLRYRVERTWSPTSPR